MDSIACKEDATLASTFNVRWYVRCKACLKRENIFSLLSPSVGCMIDFEWKRLIVLYLPWIYHDEWRILYCKLTHFDSMFCRNQTLKENHLLSFFIQNWYFLIVFSYLLPSHTHYWPVTYNHPDNDNHEK